VQLAFSLRIKPFHHRQQLLDSKILDAGFLGYFSPQPRQEVLSRVQAAAGKVPTIRFWGSNLMEHQHLIVIHKKGHNAYSKSSFSHNGGQASG
jgi:hypothetical protein